MRTLIFQGQNFQAIIEVIKESERYVLLRLSNILYQGEPLNPVSYEYVPGGEYSLLFESEKQFTPQTLLLVDKKALGPHDIIQLSPGHLKQLFVNLRVRTEDAVLRITKDTIQYEELFL